MVAVGRMLVVVAVLAAACSGSDPARFETLGPGSEVTIREDFRPEISRTDPIPVRARELARHIERKYLRVQVWKASVSQGGRVIAYAVRMRLDDRSEHPEFEDWNAHVRRTVRDQRQAAVELLKLTIRHVPEVELVSIFQDEFLQPFWSRAQIVAMDDPASYRLFEAWQDLVTSAEVIGGGLV
jgi:hypothetical protein